MAAKEDDGDVSVAAHTGTQAEVGTLRTDAGARERIPGSPLVPGCVAWAEDGRLAVVSDASVMIATFMSRELEMYLQQSPAVSKSFVYLPEQNTARRERLPVAIPVFNEPTDAGLPPGSASYFLLNEGDRHQHNPKELSLSKNGGGAFLSVTWGPRGSGPNSSCALLALTASSRVSLHFSSSFHMSWKEAAVLSETLYDFFSATNFRLAPSHDKYKGWARTSASPSAPVPPATKKRRCRSPSEEHTALNSIAEYQHKCAILSTLTMAWSPFLMTADGSATTSLIAFSGRRVSTIWAYDSPEEVAAVIPEQQRFLSPSPIAWIDTDKHGWVATSAWQQMHQQGAVQVVHQTLGLALGTAEGHVLLANVPVKARAENDSPCQVAVDRVITSPHSQPVFGLRLGSRSTYSNSPSNDLVVASGSTISVWDLKKKRSQLKAKWKAHDGNVTGLDVDYFGDTLFSCAVDGVIRVWEKATGKQLLASDAAPYGGKSDNDSNAAVTVTPPAPTSGAGRYPVFGIAVSPSSAQLASVYIIPPAARPNRKSQADVSYSRVSSSLEYIPSPWTKNPETFVDTACRILEENGSVSAFTDVVWLCYKDNASVTSLRGASEMTIPGLLNKLKGVCSEANATSEIVRQPLYLSLCQALEEHHYASMPTDGSGTASTEVVCPLFLQASFLLRSTIVPADHQAAAHRKALASIRRSLCVYWATRCLRVLLASSKKAKQPLASFLAGSESEKTSTLAMADFLSVQKSLSPASEKLVSEIYDQLESPENATAWTAFVASKAQNKESAMDADEVVAYTPPSRETCFICDDVVPFGELEMCCAAGHAQERCFLSFRVISSMDTWKCMGCGASACELDLSSGSFPFYLLDTETLEQANVGTSATSALKIVCRLCGNFCSFFKY